MTNSYIVVMVASAGGLKALSEILSNLPPDFPAPIAVVQHLDPHYPSMLAKILSKRTPLVVKQAEAGEKLKPGTVYIAPPDQHLLVNTDVTLSVSQAEKVRHVRPAGDVLFQSAAVSFQEQAIAVVLTGMDSDGAAGVQAIKNMGGIAIAQDEATADFFAMPEAAIKTGAVDFVLPLEAIASTLIQLTNR
ncbi:chemotaxis protein CheB [Fischerella thermalis BR2B]|uniref:chemotaxis protein CheB n=1 Tax=Fischerella thermalis TaxID=372787 RepID=UPI000474450C|nr:chemotaxis protein CheB [Fischerella thermalis]PMB13333.1 chemotaxis protein CheB [Fischerella thermalis CCMEE 5328]PMB36902.1 chemotaxis protein CheB [Fischerella thermalis BR2B]